MTSEELVVVPDLYLFRETPKAFLVSIEPPSTAVDDDKVWVAKSQIEQHDLSMEDKGTIQIPRWLADRNDWYYTEA